MRNDLCSGWGSKSQTKQIDEAQEMSVESPTKRLKIDKRSSSLPVGQGWAELTSSTEHVPIQYMQPRQAYSTQPSVEIRRPSTLSQRSICDETDPSKLKPPSINHHRQSKKRKSSVGSHKVNHWSIHSISKEKERCVTPLIQTRPGYENQNGFHKRCINSRKMLQPIKGGIHRSVLIILVYVMISICCTPICTVHLFL